MKPLSSPQQCWVSVFEWAEQQHHRGWGCHSSFQSCYTTGDKLGHCVITNTLVPWQQQWFCLFFPKNTCSRCHSSGQDSTSTAFPSIFVLNTQCNTFGNQISFRGIDTNAEDMPALLFFLTFSTIQSDLHLVQLLDDTFIILTTFFSEKNKLLEAITALRKSFAWSLRVLHPKLWHVMSGSTTGPQDASPCSKMQWTRGGRW